MRRRPSETFHHLPVTESIEEAMDRLATHWCRHTNASLSPDVCEKRKKKARNPLSDMGFNPFWMCISCQGAEEKEKREMKTYHCLDCGEDKHWDYFYQSNKSHCKECIKKKNEERRVAKLNSEEPPQATGVMKVCTKCGKEFEEYLRGCTVPNICRACVSSSLSVASYNREKPNNQIVMILRTDRDEELLKRLKALALKERRDVASQALAILDRELMAKETE